MADQPALTLADQVLINAAGWLTTATRHDPETEARVLAQVHRWLPHGSWDYPRLKPILSKLQLLILDESGREKFGAQKGVERAIVVMGLRGDVAALMLLRMHMAAAKLTGTPAPEASNA